MRQVVDRLCSFELRSQEPGFLVRIGLRMKTSSRWDEPKLEPCLLPR